MTSEQNQSNTSSNLRDNSTVEVSSRAENKVVQNLFTVDNKCVTNERNRREPKKSSISSNLSQSVCLDIGKDMLDSQDQELSSILEELKIPGHNLPLERSVNTSATRITGYFCFGTLFNLNNRVLTDLEIKVLEKGLDFPPIQRKINAPELRQDFGYFCRRMSINWFCRNEPTP